MHSKDEYNLHVLMFPWLAHGHISPFLELAKKLSQHNFYIYFCSTPINLSSIKDQLSTKTFPSIQLVELHLPSIPNLPPQYHTTKSLPPHLMSTLKEAVDMSQPSFSSLLSSLKPDLVIYDFLQPWVSRVASHHNIPSIHFMAMGAASTCYLYHMCKITSVEFPFKGIYYHPHEYSKMAQLLQSCSNNISNGDRLIKSIDGSSSIILIKTCREIEAKYIDHLSYILGGKEVVPVGAIVQEDPTSTNNGDDCFMSWLDKKEKNSVVFVSFGSEYFMSKEEIAEIGHGLELSGVSFIWVIRFHQEERNKVEEVLPEGWLERVGERGMVVEGWAPQVKILRHGSIGGFVSHCGWSSVVEGLRYGVPLIATPMQLDQPLNARLVASELGVGVDVKRRDDRRVDGVEMAKVIGEVVVDKGGEEVKRRMKEVNEKMRDGEDPEMNFVVGKLMELCDKRWSLAMQCKR